MKLDLQEIRNKTLPVTIIWYAYLENKTHEYTNQTSSMNGTGIQINIWCQARAKEENTQTHDGLDGD